MRFSGWIVALLVVSACANESSTSRDQSVEFSIPRKDEIAALRAQALSGGKIEAVRLAAWYMKFPSEVDTFEFWSLVAAENGSDVGQYNNGMLYLAKRGRGL